jgi:hypothetical protein
MAPDPCRQQRDRASAVLARIGAARQEAAAGRQVGKVGHLATNSGSIPGKAGASLRIILGIQVTAGMLVTPNRTRPTRAARLPIRCSTSPVSRSI